ncbi:CHIA-like protein, partial [Mya arenaria]
NKLKNFCYFTNWSPSLANFEARFDVENINATLCSHLIYAFANIDVVELKIVKSEIGDDNGSLTNKQGRYFEFNKLKIRNSELVTLLSISGTNGKGWFQVVASETSMQTFAQNVAIFLRDRDFDGIDLDWEYPLELYRNKFTQLLQYSVFTITIDSACATALQVFRRQFENEAMQTSKPRLLISIAVGVSEYTISKSYNIPQISRFETLYRNMFTEYGNGGLSDVLYCFPLHTKYR